MSDSNKYWWGCGELEPYTLMVRMENGAATLEKQFGIILKKNLNRNLVYDTANSFQHIEQKKWKQITTQRAVWECYSSITTNTRKAETNVH